MAAIRPMAPRSNAMSGDAGEACAPKTVMTHNNRHLRGHEMGFLSANDTVAYEIVDGVAWLRFNRPDKRNCMSPTLNIEMMQALDDLEYSDEVRVLVLTGEGTAWSAGMDLKEYF